MNRALANKGMERTNGAPANMKCRSLLIRSVGHLLASPMASGRGGARGLTFRGWNENGYPPRYSRTSSVKSDGQGGLGRDAV